MKKSSIILFSAALTGVLTGCSGNKTQNPDVTSEAPTETVVEETTVDVEPMIEEVYTPEPDYGTSEPSVDYSEGEI